MLNILTSLAFILCLMILLITILNLVSKKTFSDKEKNSPFECGFDPKSYSRLPFSIQFFLIALIFLVFDIEIALILPIIKIIKFSNLSYLFITFNLIMFILILGLIHEWNQGALKWLK